MGFPPGKLHPSRTRSFGGCDLRDLQNLDLDHLAFGVRLELFAAFALRLQQAPQNEGTTLIPRLNEQLLVLHALDFAPEPRTLLKLDSLPFRSFAFFSLGFLDIW